MGDVGGKGKYDATPPNDYCHWKDLDLFWKIMSVKIAMTSL